MQYLQRLLSMTDGVYGARFSGAGTRGACVAIVKPEAAEAVAEHVLAAYKLAHPEYAGKCSACLCDTGDGASVVRVLEV